MDVERTAEAALPEFLCRQRWFGGKGRAIAGVAIEDAVDLPPDDRVRLLMARVSYRDGASDLYALVTGVVADPGAAPVIARIEETGDWLVEASADAGAAGRLLAAFAEPGRRLPSRRGGRLIHADTREAAPRVFRAGVPQLTALGAEQSNTSMRVGRSFIFKLIRRLEPGENPEVEMGRFLTTRTAFRALAPLEGSITYGSASGDATTVGVLQAWVDSQGDGWTYVLDALGRAEPSAAATRLMEDVTRLGAVTAELHLALASAPDLDAFRPEPVDAADLDLWARALRALLPKAARLISSKRSGWTGETGRLGEAVLEAVRTAGTRGDLHGPRSGGFDKIRIHGDYHLGQTLKTADGFAVIDFEGEPARPIAERRRKACALKDVAGMLRSFEYAIEMAAGGDPDRAARLRLTSPLRDAFLDSYFASVGAPGIRLVPAREQALGWLRMFELEKALYELEYEINNRPSWVAIPLAGVLRALAGGAP
jgi:maltose alpha-D-glucosyltransferase/alpha-amylase